MRLPFLLVLFSLVLTFSSVSTSAATCGIDNYDFTSIGKSDYYGFATDYSEIYYLRLCSTVQNLWCQLNSNTADSMVCQVNGGDTSSTFNIANNDTSSLKWSYVQSGNASAGVNFQSQTGEYCGPTGHNRALAGTILCGNTTGTLFPVVENPTCTYNLILTSPLICSAGQVDPEAEEHMRLAEKAKEEYKKLMNKK